MVGHLLYILTSFTNLSYSSPIHLPLGIVIAVLPRMITLGQNAVFVGGRTPMRTEHIFLFMTLIRHFSVKIK